METLNKKHEFKCIDLNNVSLFRSSPGTSLHEKIVRTLHDPCGLADKGFLKDLWFCQVKKYLFLLNTRAVLARIYLNERNRSIVSVTGLVSSSAQGVLLLD